MHFARFHKAIFGVGLAFLLLAVGWIVQRAFAHPGIEQVAQASPLHPTFALLDKDGQNVLESGQPVSTMETCGECHDTEFIASHSFHADLGASQQVPAGSAPSGRPWDTSTGLYGEWNSLTYRYLSPAGDSRTDLDSASWMEANAARLAGGGPADAQGLEMNCFLCHLEQPDNAARIAAIQGGQPEWAGTATLLATGIVEQEGAAYQWNPAAFTPEGELDEVFISIQDPSSANCAQCHGVAHTDLEQPLALAGCSLDNWQTATTGQVISGQKISVSGVNLAGKADLARSWDIHAERGLTCTDCHYSANNPAYVQSDPARQPAHLEFDPRRLELGEYLQRPDHNFASGNSTANMRTCASCHDETIHAAWLPYSERHLQELACETCHIPAVYAPAVQSYDWTVLRAGGEPVQTCRGVEGDTGVSAAGALTDLVTGFQPVLLERTQPDGKTQLAPYNLVTSWYWVYDETQADQPGPRPVRLEDLKAAWFEGDAYAPAVLQAFDADGDGLLSDVELRIDTPEKKDLIAGRLAKQGLSNPRIEGEVQPYNINHNVAGGDWATRECQSCHASDSRLAASLTLSGYLPGGVTPDFTQGGVAQAASDLSVEDGALVYRPLTQDQGRYVFGHNRVGWIDGLGIVFFVGVLIGVGVHGGLRLQSALKEARRRGRSAAPSPQVKRVYMYAVYERFWHWLQTFTIIMLLFTGLIIHRPDVFGWLSFRYMVVVHNILAIVLVINAFLSLFYHLVSGEIRQYIPHPYGFFDQAIVQAKFYMQGIFKGGAHPFEKTPDKKLNPLQQATYFGILNVLLPLQVLTGLLMFGVQQFPEVAQALGGLPFLAPFHSLVAWTFAAFIVAHVYLTTTGHAPLTGIQAMMNGWEEVEAHGSHEETGAPAPDAAAAD